ncbi:hypothetical protein MHTCC0001_28030 [Flavobacteriaceae bacterium MHTCC 0001]
MRYLFLFTILCLTLSIQAQDDADFKSQTVEFIKLTGTAAAFDDAINQIGMAVPADKKAAYKNEASGTLEELYNKLADLYMSEFTKDEIKALVAFYKTDLGKKLASKQIMLAQKGMMMGQSWGMEVQGIAQKYK